MHTTRCIADQGALGDFDIDAPVGAAGQIADGAEDFAGAVAPAQFERRNVYRDTHWRQAHELPVAAIRGRTPQHPGADGRHQAGGFEHGQEYPRCDQAIVAVPPAQQRLGSGNLAGGERDFGLIVQHELITLEAAAQALLHADALRELRTGLLAVMQVLLTCQLGFLECSLGVLHQLVGLLAIIWKDGHATSDLERDFAAIDLEGSVERGGDVAMQQRHLRVVPHRQCGEADEGAAA